MLQNLHTHTTWCDGADSPEEIIQAALEKGFGAIGFSGHAYMPWIPAYARRGDRTADYKKEIAGLKEAYRGRIDIYCGLEAEFYSPVDLSGYDYLIGSVHYLEFDGQPAGFDRGLPETVEYIRKYFGGDGMQLAKRYYETLCRLPERGNFDILGHFDLIAKNNETGRFLDTDSREYLDYGFQAIHALRGKIPLFEVNTGAIARGYRTVPYPQPEFLKEFRSCGYGAVITSDCHNKNYLDCHFDTAVRLLKQAGFRTKWVLTDTGFQEVAL